MRITQIRQILEIEKSTSISQAARTLFVSQPALSSLLTEFEDEIGVRIFTRTKSGVVPTEDGVLILDAMKRIMKEVAYIDQYSARAHELTGSVSFVLGNSFDFLYTELIGRFKTLFPKAQLLFRSAYETNTLSLVEKELLDFSILAQEFRGKEIDVMGDKAAKMIPLKTVHSFAVVHPLHPLAQAHEIPLSALRSEQIILGWQYEMEALIKKAKWEKYPITGLERGVMLELVREKQGVLLDATPLSPEKYQYYYPEVVPIPIINDIDGLPQKLLEWPTYFFYRPHTSNKLKKLFMQEIKDILEEHQLLETKE